MPPTWITAQHMRRGYLEKQITDWKTDFVSDFGPVLSEQQKWSFGRCFIAQQQAPGRWIAVRTTAASWMMARTSHL
jgi:hypothetical protein